MEKQCVSREEFENLRAEVENVKLEMNKSWDLLQIVDKKIDVISEKLVSAERIHTLSLNPMQKQLDEIKDSNKWLWRSIIGTIITIATKIIFDINK